MDKDIIDKVKILANQARMIFDFDKVIIYGSQVNGTYTIDSDIDVAFFVNQTNPAHWTISAKLFELVDSIDNRIETIIINPNTDKSGFAQNILDTGVEI